MAEATSGLQRWSVFLSGGTHTPWRDDVRASLSDLPVEFFDPGSLADAGQFSMDEIARIEIEWLARSDCVFFYFEESNPSGLGSAFEIGFAHARGIPVVFVDEKRTSHTEWLSALCMATEYDLSAGLISLRTFLNGLGHRTEEEQ